MPLRTSGRHLPGHYIWLHRSFPSVALNYPIVEINKFSLAAEQYLGKFQRPASPEHSFITLKNRTHHTKPMAILEFKHTLFTQALVHRTGAPYTFHPSTGKSQNPSYRFRNWPYPLHSCSGKSRNPPYQSRNSPYLSHSSTGKSQNPPYQSRNSLNSLHPSIGQISKSTVPIAKSTVLITPGHWQISKLTVHFSPKLRFITLEHRTNCTKALANPGALRTITGKLQEFTTGQRNTVTQTQNVTDKYENWTGWATLFTHCHLAKKNIIGRSHHSRRYKKCTQTCQWVLSFTLQAKYSFQKLVSYAQHAETAYVYSNNKLKKLCPM